MKLIDYIFYRTYSFYKNKKDSIPIMRGAQVISLMLFLTCFSILTLLSTIANVKLNNYLKFYTLAFLLILLAATWKRYSKKNYKKILEEKYQNENLKKKHVRGWLIIAYLMLVILIPISIGYMRHNLGWDI